MGEFDDIAADPPPPPRRLYGTPSSQRIGEQYPESKALRSKRLCAHRHTNIVSRGISGLGQGLQGPSLGAQRPRGRQSIRPLEDRHTPTAYTAYSIDYIANCCMIGKGFSRLPPWLSPDMGPSARCLSGRGSRPCYGGHKPTFARHKDLAILMRYSRETKIGWGGLGRWALAPESNQHRF